MYKERFVKNPLTNHVCDLCGSKISGQHVYVSTTTKFKGFTTMRLHEKCNAQLKEMCSGCIYKDQCFSDFKECFNGLKEKGLIK